MLFLIEKLASKIKRQASFLHVVNNLYLIAMAQKMFGEKNDAVKTFTLWRSFHRSQRQAKELLGSKNYLFREVGPLAAMQKAGKRRVLLSKFIYM